MPFHLVLEAFGGNLNIVGGRQYSKSACARLCRRSGTSAWGGLIKSQIRPGNHIRLPRLVHALHWGWEERPGRYWGALL